MAAHTPTMPTTHGFSSARLVTTSRHRPTSLFHPTVGVHPLPSSHPCVPVLPISESLSHCLPLSLSLSRTVFSLSFSLSVCVSLSLPLPPPSLFSLLSRSRLFLVPSLPLIHFIGAIPCPARFVTGGVFSNVHGRFVGTALCEVGGNARTHRVAVWVGGESVRERVSERERERERVNERE